MTEIDSLFMSQSALIIAQRKLIADLEALNAALKDSLAAQMSENSELRVLLSGMLQGVEAAALAAAPSVSEMVN